MSADDAGWTIAEQDQFYFEDEFDLFKGWKHLEEPPAAGPRPSNWQVATHGDGPYPVAVFDAILRDIGYEVTRMLGETEVLILGRRNFHMEKVDDLIDKRQGQELRIYSQEMFLASLLRDGPYDLDNMHNEFAEHSFECFRDGHPALERLSESLGEFPGISAIAQGRGNLVLDFDGDDKGALSSLGYHVGKTRGLPAHQRRQVLTKVMYCNLRPVGGNEAYIAEWGEPESADRLRKLANCLSTFATNAMRRQGADMSVAIEHWSSDLAWLEEEFHRGHMKFPWPNLE